MKPGITALVLAGQRDGVADPLGEAHGTPYKALSPVAGRPMILHVLEALEASPLVDTIIVSINEGANLAALPEVQAMLASGKLRLSPSRMNLVDSVTHALVDAAFPVLVTTADTVLMTPGSVAEIVGQARAEGARVAVAFARKASVLAAHPDGQRRFYGFSDDGYSNCNSYWLGDRSALGPVEVFRSGGQFVKHPMRIVGAFGVLNLIRFRYGIGTLDGLFRRLSGRFRMTIRPVVVSDGALAIDVDNARTLGVAEALLASRPAPAQTSAMPIAAE